MDTSRGALQTNVPMSALRKLKKEMLRGAIQENLELQDDREYLRRRFRRPSWVWPVKALAAIGVAIVVFPSVNAISTGGTEGPEVLVVKPGAVSKRSLDAPPRAPHAIEPTLFRLEVAKVVLDAGHGGNDPGASAASGLTEKEITLDVARRLRTLLEQDRFQVAMTRQDDRSLVLRDRALMANAEHADLFVSIHVNSIPEKERRAVETYFLGPADTPRISEMARKENQGSGYALSDFKKLLEGVYQGVRQEESRRLAEAVQTNLFSALRKETRAIEDRGVKSAPLAVLIGTEMPAILVEVSCVSNTEEARLLARPDYRQDIAKALYRGLEVYMESREPARETGTVASGKGI